MKNLRARVPEGTYTPDQVAASLELNLLLNGDVTSLRNGITTLISLVPAKRQGILKAMLTEKDDIIIPSVQAFIEEVNAKLAPVLKELEQQATPVEPVEIPQPVVYEGDEWDRPTGRKPNSRESRALRKAKRQSEA